MRDSTSQQAPDALGSHARAARVQGLPGAADQSALAPSNLALTLPLPAAMCAYCERNHERLTMSSTATRGRRRRLTFRPRNGG
jgi:hypothetical protein